MIHVRTRHPSLGHGSERGGSLGLLAREAEDETDSDPFTELPVMLRQGSGSAPGCRLAVKSWAPANSLQEAWAARQALLMKMKLFYFLQKKTRETVQASVPVVFE
jgi:hypothetical protein